MSFKEIAVEDLHKYVDENTKLVIDYDQIAFLSAAVVEKREIDAIHLPTGKVKRFKNKTEFIGAKKVAIEGWLGDLNVMRVAKGQKPFAREEFEIKEVQIAPDVSYANYAVKAKIEAITNHLGISNYIGVMGKGETFRHQLELPKKYKSNRETALRPLLLPEARLYLEKYYPIEVVSEIEADDRLCHYGFKGYRNYQKTGKFSYIPVTFDKDTNSTPCCYFNMKRDKSKFKNPNPWLIDDGVGEIWMEKQEVKAYGFYWLACQMCKGDNSDYVRPYQDFDLTYGDANCYKDLANCTNPAEVIEAVKDRYYKWFPNGVEYTSWTGKLMRLTTLEWMEMMFQLVYMQRIPNDKTTFSKVAKHYGVNL